MTQEEFQKIVLESLSKQEKFNQSLDERMKKQEKLTEKLSATMKQEFTDLRVLIENNIIERVSGLRDEVIMHSEKSVKEHEERFYHQLATN